MPERKKSGTSQIGLLRFSLILSYILWRNYRMPCAIMAFATFMNPATLAPFT